MAPKFEEEKPVLSENMSAKNKSRHNSEGEEILDPTPMQPPLGYKKQPSLHEQIRAAVIASKLDEMYALEETEEEADDFNVEDDFEPSSPHENDHVPSLAELKATAKALNEQIYKAALEEEAAKTASRPAPSAPEAPKATPEANTPAK